MILNIRELISWLGLSIFEIWLHVVSLLVFSVLLAVKLEHDDSMTWWNVFIPLFACEGCVAYFSAIVFMRLFLAGNRRLAGTRTFWTTVTIVLFLTYKIMLCQLLEKQRTDYVVIHVPVFIFLKVLAVRACQVE